MNTRRIPFQFSTTDPLARQRELERRFGLQPTCPKMFVDVNNPLSMGSTPKEVSSPRLQHRVPIFVEGYDQPIHSSSVDSMASVPENKKPNVRVIPIEIEGTDRSPRHRTYSGPAGTLRDRCDNLASERNGVPPFKRFNFEDLSKPKLNAEPKVFNIPVQIEGDSNISRSAKSTVSTSNECSQSKIANKVKTQNKSEVSSEPNENQADQPKNTVKILLKKIEDVLNEFKTYETGVVEFTGTSKDKQYRYLDEMLTRCMLRLDDIDTMGNEEIRLARKGAVKKIQASIDLLESKANVEPATSIEVDREGNQLNDNSVSAESTATSEMNQIGSDIKDQSQGSSNSLNDEETKTNDVIDVEMHEVPQDKTPVVNASLCETINVTDSCDNKAINLSEVPSNAKDVMQGEESSTSSLQHDPNVIPEIEMSDKKILHKIDSVSDAQSPELLGSDNKCAEQNSVSCETVPNDVEMVDEKDPMSNLIVGKESLNDIAKNESHLSKPDEIPEVEMEEIGDVSSKESGEKKDMDLQVISNVSLEDSEVSSGVHETVDNCLPDLSGQDGDGTFETNESEKVKTLKN